LQNNQKIIKERKYMTKNIKKKAVVDDRLMVSFVAFCLAIPAIFIWALVIEFLVSTYL